MPTVHIPSQMRDLTGGLDQVEIEAKTVRQMVENLEEKFPGIQARLCEEGDIRVTIAVWVDGDQSRNGLMTRLEKDSDVHFLPMISGGRAFSLQWQYS